MTLPQKKDQSEEEKLYHGKIELVDEGLHRIL
jgi:hypothetical protein